MEKDKSGMTGSSQQDVSHTGLLLNEDISELSDEDLESYLTQNGHPEEKRMYRASPDFINRSVAGEVLIVPTGKAAYNLNALITLTEGGAFLWEHLKQEPWTKVDLIRLLANEYDVAIETAVQDVSSFLEKALANGVIF